jgi:hypothetical protein
MARYGKAEDSIHCIPDGTAISRGLTRQGFATILVLGVQVVFLAAQAPAAPQAPLCRWRHNHQFRHRSPATPPGDAATTSDVAL